MFGVMRVELVRGTRRRKYIEAVLVGDTLRVSYPNWMSLREARAAAAEMRTRMERRLAADRIDLVKRARGLARRYDLPPPRSVRWVGNQHARWGSCTPEDRSIRVSTRLAAFPDWVLDYVLVHELAHFVVPNHGRSFRALIDRYPLAERARGFLIARDLDPRD